VVEGLGNYVAVQEGGGDLLAPNAERRDAGAGVVRRELPFVGIAIGILVIAVLVVVGLRLAIGSAADDTAQQINKLIQE
jgi:type VI secretion system protein ImpK